MSKTANQRVYHLSGSNSKPSKGRKSPKRRSNKVPIRESTIDEENEESHGTERRNEVETISPRKTSLPPPPGLKNVGNTCYANAALQCLLSTALPHALLDERNAQIIRKHSFNRKLLVYGSGSVDSEDTSRDDDADSAYGSCLTGMSTIYDEEDEQCLARALEDGNNNFGRGISSKFGRKKKWSRRSKDDASVFSQSTVHSEMYQVVDHQRNNDQTLKGGELSSWLTDELTQMTIDYTKPARKSARAPQSGFVGSFLGYGGSNNRPNSNRVVDPGSITRKVHVISPTLRPYQQEDAHEFFRTLLSALTMHGRNPRLSSLFDGLLESSVTCKTCEKVSLTRDRYMDLSLDINNDSIHTLSDALKNFTMDETLDKDNKVTCTRCKAKRVVTKGLRLATAPTMLVINYKRFAYDMYGRMSRIAKNVSFPLRLVIKDFMSKANRGKPPPYSLVAVLVHKGRSCDRGHYIAYVRKGKDWYLANDEVVTKVSVDEVLSAQAYVLVYEVEGMKEKHNFDCYSRYHESFDNKGDDVESLESLRQKGGVSMWDFSALTQLLDSCGDVALCGNTSNVMDNPSVKSKGSASRYSFDEGDDNSMQRGTNKIDNYNLDTKREDDINRKHYKRGRSYTPSQRSRDREEEEEEDSIQGRSYRPSKREDDDYHRRRTRSASLVEKKSRGKEKEKVTSTTTKAPRRKNSDRDSALPPLQPRSDSPKDA